MKKVDMKTLIITSIICILPIFLGLAFYSTLPDKMAFHFNRYSQPDNYGSKNLVIFGFPVLMMFIQVFLCVVSDFASKNTFQKTKLGKIMKWVIPAMNLVIYAMLLSFSLGNDFNMKFAFFLVGSIVLIFGNYLPKMPVSYAKEIIHPPSLAKDEKSWRTTSRITSTIFIILGVFLILSIFIF